MKRTKKICPICGKEISVSNFKRHIISCSGCKNAETTDYKFTILDNGMCKCNICGKEYSAKGIHTHIWRSHGAGKLFDPNINNYGKPNVRKGWTKETHPEIIEQNRKAVETSKKKRSLGLYKKPVFSKEFLRRTSERMSLNNPGGKSKWFIVNGIKVQGTWEKYFAEELTRLKIKWQRGPCINWKDNTGKLHTYSPDFYLPDYGMMYEIKGFWWGNDKNKMKLVYAQNKELRGKLLILRSYDMMNKILKNLVL